MCYVGVGYQLGCNGGSPMVRGAERVIHPRLRSHRAIPSAKSGRGVDLLVVVELG